ncbi:zinc finger matrin-type protein 4-like isoform X1 [Diaphorina citri]|uniref:Zinc finger matrin-type protein 4-like isoform X1 n=1 Tax=Diaphorina citri TaxID=121845 RepID=A0A3Q0IVM2_DIACI|nr:zinc finger matrin-type protein 4-like isoform X1 [Diaphorina citri]
MNTMNPLKRSGDENLEKSPDSVKKSKLEGVKPPLPKELSKLFQPLYCALCKSQLSSSVTAASHYSGKPHQKKVNQYLSQHHPELLNSASKQTDEKKSDQVPTSTSLTLTRDEATNCRICNVVFAGPIAAQSHYLGKKHRSKVLKGYTPIEPVPGMGIVEDNSGRFGIGESFRKCSDIETPKLTIVKKTVQKWYCDICDTQATDDNQYKAHLAGKKHIKNVKNSKLVTIISDAIEKPKDSILNSVMKSEHSSDQDYSINRTPSGDFYCKICDLAINSAIQFSDHLKSKKHNKKTKPVV